MMMTMGALMMMTMGIDDDDDGGIGKLRDSRSNPGSRDRWGDGGMATGKLIDINLGKHFFIEHVQCTFMYV